MVGEEGLEREKSSNLAFGVHAKFVGLSGGSEKEISSQKEGGAKCSTTSRKRSHNEEFSGNNKAILEQRTDGDASLRTNSQMESAEGPEKNNATYPKVMKGRRFLAVRKSDGTNKIIELKGTSAQYLLNAKKPAIQTPGAMATITSAKPLDLNAILNSDSRSELKPKEEIGETSNSPPTAEKGRQCVNLTKPKAQISSSTPDQANARLKTGLAYEMSKIISKEYPKSLTAPAVTSSLSGPSQREKQCMCDSIAPQIATLLKKMDSRLQTISNSVKLLCDSRTQSQPQPNWSSSFSSSFSSPQRGLIVKRPKTTFGMDSAESSNQQVLNMTQTSISQSNSPSVVQNIRKKIVVRAPNGGSTGISTIPSSSMQRIIHNPVASTAQKERVTNKNNGNTPSANIPLQRIPQYASSGNDGQIKIFAATESLNARKRIIKAILAYPGSEFTWQEFYESAPVCVKSATKTMLLEALQMLVTDQLLYQENEECEMLGNDTVWQKEQNKANLRCLRKYDVKLQDYLNSLTYTYDGEPTKEVIKIENEDIKQEVMDD